MDEGRGRGRVGWVGPISLAELAYQATRVALSRQLPGPWGTQKEHRELKNREHKTGNTANIRTTQQRSAIYIFIATYKKPHSSDPPPLSRMPPHGPSHRAIITSLVYPSVPLLPAFPSFPPLPSFPSLPSLPSSQPPLPNIFSQQPAPTSTTLPVNRAYATFISLPRLGPEFFMAMGN